MSWFSKILKWFKRTETPIPFSWKGKKYVVRYNGVGWIVERADGSPIWNVIFASSENAIAYLKNNID